MHGITHFLNRNQSRESTPPNDDSSDGWHSSLSSTDSRGNNEASGRAIQINQRSSYAQRSFRGSPLEFASSPRDRYPNFASYFREVMEGRGSSSQHHHQSHHSDHRRRTEGERYQIGVNTYQVNSRHDYRQFVSPLFNDAMDDIQENEYSKCERYGEITNPKVIKSRFDNKSFAQKLAECAKEQHPNERGERVERERRGSGSSGSSGHRHKHHSIQELIRTFSKKMGHWRHDSGGGGASSSGAEGRRGSCAIPVTTNDRASDEEFRSRSKSLDGDHLHKINHRSILDDCGATYQIFDEILREGI